MNQSSVSNIPMLDLNLTFEFDADPDRDPEVAVRQRLGLIDQLRAVHTHRRRPRSVSDLALQLPEVVAVVSLVIDEYVEPAVAVFELFKCLRGAAESLTGLRNGYLIIRGRRYSLLVLEKKHAETFLASRGPVERSDADDG